MENFFSNLKGDFMEYIFNTQGTCSRRIKFDLNDNIVTNVKFLDGGCPR